jgi:hypothetical protein
VILPAFATIEAQLRPSCYTLGFIRGVIEDPALVLLKLSLCHQPASSVLMGVARVKVGRGLYKRTRGRGALCTASATVL